MFLSEDLTPNVVQMRSMTKGKDMYLSGLFMVGDRYNGNRRMYPMHEIKSAVDQAHAQMSQNITILGELQHPNTMAINLDRVSHIITELRMNGSDAYGKMKLLDTPTGLLSKALLNGGARLGVSSRGEGSLTEGGVVAGYKFSTIDIVAVPSGPGCYPDMIYESQNLANLTNLAEAAVHDARAQVFLAEEIKKFMNKVAGV